MPDIIFRCQIRAGEVPAGDPRALYIARLACAAVRNLDLDGNDPLWPFLAPWRWEALGWHLAKADGSFVAAPSDAAHPHTMLDDAKARIVEARLGRGAAIETGLPGAATALSVDRTAQPPDPDLVALTPLPSHGARNWLNVLEGLGTGPGALARKLGLATLLRPDAAALEECLADRMAFAPSFRLAGQDYLPDRWTLVRLPEAVGLDTDNRNALLVSYTPAGAGQAIAALVLPTLHHQAAAPLSYVDSKTLDVALSGAAGQSWRFDRDWPASFTRRVAEAFDLPTRLADPAIAQAVYQDPLDPGANHEANWDNFLRRVFASAARDASGTGIMATAAGTIPAARLLGALADPGTSDQAALPAPARDAILGALAAYEISASGIDADGWADLFKLFLAAEDQAGGTRPGGIRSALAARSALLARQDVTAAFLLRQWRDALAGPDGSGYVLNANDMQPIAQAYVAPALPIAPTGWVSLIPPYAGLGGTGDQTAQPFHISLTVTLGAAAAGDILALRLTADPVGPAAGASVDLELSDNGAALVWTIAGVQVPGEIVRDGQRIHLKAVVWLSDGHVPVAIRMDSAAPAAGDALPSLGARPPRVDLIARRQLAIAFGAPGLADQIGRGVLPGQAPPNAVAGTSASEPFFASPYAERLARLDPQGWLIQGPLTLAGARASGSGAAPDPNVSLRERMLAMVCDAYDAWITARFDPAAARPLLPLAQAADAARLVHLADMLKTTFRASYGDAAKRPSTLLVPLDSGAAVDLPLPDAHPIVVPYVLGDAIEANDLLGETTGVAVLVAADGRPFAPDMASAPSFAGTFTLSAAQLDYRLGQDSWADADEELAVGARPTPREGADIRTFAFEARPLVAPLKVEVAETAIPGDLHVVRPSSSPDPALAWGRTIPQMRFGWHYAFRSFLVAQGGALPPDLWEGGDPAKLRRPAVDDAGFSTPIHYLCRTPVAAPRWDLRKTAGPAKNVPEGASPLANELPDLPPPIEIPEQASTTFYVAEQDGSGLIPLERGTPLEIRLYGLHLADQGEAVLALRCGRIGAPEESIAVRIGVGDAPSVVLEDGSVAIVLPKDKRDGTDADPGEWHLRITIIVDVATIRVGAALLMEADPDGRKATLEPDQIHSLEQLGEAVLAVQPVVGNAHIALLAQTGALRVVPPRVWAGPHRQVCPETAGQQPEIVALDSRSRPVSLRVRPPAVPFATWVRHLLSDTALGDPRHNQRIDAAYLASQQTATPGRDATLDHPRVTALFLEVVPLFPRTRTAGELFEIPLVAEAGDPHGDRKRGLDLEISRGPPLPLDQEASDIDVQVVGSQAKLRVAPGRTVEVRVYAAVHIDDFEGAKARFSPALARGRRRIGQLVLGAPLRLRAEASADAKQIDDFFGKYYRWRDRFTECETDNYAIWGHPIMDGIGKLQRVEARPTLAAPQSRAVARTLRLFASVTVFDQRWSWRGRTGVVAPPAGEAQAEAFGGWSQRLFHGRSDSDAEFAGPVALTPFHIRRRDNLADRPETPLVMRDLGYRGRPILWRFALEFHGRYPAEPGFDRRTLAGPAEKASDRRHASWAHVLARGALAPPGHVAGLPPEPRRPALELWLPLAEQLRDASAAAPVMLLFAEPWHPQGDLGDRLQIVSLLTRHPYPGDFDTSSRQPAGIAWDPALLMALFGGEAGFLAEKQYPKYWQSWGPDPILTGASTPFAAVSLLPAGPLGWTQSEGSVTDFRRSSFLVEPQSELAIAAHLAKRPMFQLLYRRLADPELTDPPAQLKPNAALWRDADDIGTAEAPRRRLRWSFHPAQVPVNGQEFSGQPIGYQGLRLDWGPPSLNDGQSLMLRIEDDATAATVPRRLVVTLDRSGARIRMRAAMSEPLLDRSPTEWRINHLPPIELAVSDGLVDLRLELSPTAPADPAAVAVAPDTFDVILWTRARPNAASDDAPWLGGMLARLKAPDGAGALRFDLPGTPDSLGATARLTPFAASAFSAPFWVQFFGDSSRFRCGPANAIPTTVQKVEALRLSPVGQRVRFATVEQAADTYSAVLPLVIDDAGTIQDPAPQHRLVAVITRWVANAEGHPSEMPAFAAPVRTDATGSYVTVPTGSWPVAGRMRLLTVLATKEAPPFAPDDPNALPFRILDAILRPEPAQRGQGAGLTPYDLDTADSELREAQMMVIGVSRPIEFG